MARGAQHQKYRKHVRAMLADGYVNRPDGSWADPGFLDMKVRSRAESIKERMAGPSKTKTK